MPELPEVETTRRGISPHLSGKRVERVEIRESRLRWPIPTDLATQITGQTLRSIDRRGKYLLLRFDHGHAIWHLGMSGSLRILNENQAPGKHDHVDWVFAKDTVLRFNDPRRFGALLWTSEPLDQHLLLQHLGPEPLSPQFDEHALFKRSRGRTQPVKAFLMDARTVVGVGNIYANESLFLSGVHPLKAAGRLSFKQCVALVAAIKTVLANAITRGGTTLRDFVGGDGQPGYFAQELKVYGRGGQPCLTCAKRLTEKALAKRTTVYCTACQK